MVRIEVLADDSASGSFSQTPAEEHGQKSGAIIRFGIDEPSDEMVPLLPVCQLRSTNVRQSSQGDDFAPPSDCCVVHASRTEHDDDQHKRVCIEILGDSSDESEDSEDNGLEPSSNPGARKSGCSAPLDTATIFVYRPWIEVLSSIEVVDDDTAKLPKMMLHHISGLAKSKRRAADSHTSPASRSRSTSKRLRGLRPAVPAPSAGRRSNGQSSTPRTLAATARCGYSSRQSGR